MKTRGQTQLDAALGPNCSPVLRLLPSPPAYADEMTHGYLRFRARFGGPAAFRALKARLNAAGFRHVHYCRDGRIFALPPSLDGLLYYSLFESGVIEVCLAADEAELLAGAALLCAAIGVEAPKKIWRAARGPCI